MSLQLVSASAAGWLPVAICPAALAAAHPHPDAAVTPPPSTPIVTIPHGRHNAKIIVMPSGYYRTISTESVDECMNTAREFAGWARDPAYADPCPASQRSRQLSHLPETPPALDKVTVHGQLPGVDRISDAEFTALAQAYPRSAVYLPDVFPGCRLFLSGTCVTVRLLSNAKYTYIVDTWDEAVRLQPIFLAWIRDALPSVRLAAAQ
jgi:hypothetical protein